jgi:predicted RND superfamily exporter protein
MPIGSQEKRQGLLLAIEEFSRRHYRSIFLVTLLAVAVAALLGSRLHLDTDILALVPRGDRAVDAFKTSLQEFGGADYIAILIEAPSGHTADEYEDFADRYAEKVAALDGILQVEHRIGGSSELLALFRKYALVFLRPEDLPKLREKLSDDAIRAQVAENRRILENPSSTFLKEIVRIDPLGLRTLLWSHLLKGKGALKLNTSNGYYMAQDESALLVLLKPAKPSQDLGFTAALIAALKNAEAETRRELTAEGETHELERMTLDYAGSYVVALEDSNLIKSDMKVTAIFSFVGVLGLYLIGYRRLGALFYSSGPLMVGQALTFAVAFLVFGHLNSASSGFVAMVMGLGTDFTIVMYARYVEERQQGRSLAEASRLMMGEGGLGMFTGAITSAGTFYSMCVTKFRGLWELGFLIGTGILMSMIAILFLLPAMIQWNESRPRRKDVVRKLHIQSFGFEHLIPVAGRHPVVTLAAIASVTCVLGVSAWNVGFSDNIRDLRSRSNKGTLAQEKVTAKFGGDLNFMIAIVEAPTVDGAVEKVSAVLHRARPFLDDGSLRGADSIVNYLPATSSQLEVIKDLRAGAAHDFNADRVEATFRQALADQGFREDAFDDYLAEFRAVLARGKPLTLADLQEARLGAVLDRYVRPVTSESGAATYRAAVYLFLEEGKWRREAPPGLVAALQGDDPAISVTGVNVVSKRLREIFAHDATVAISLGVLLVSVLLWLDFRSLRHMLLANLQVLTGVVWMLGVMSLTGVQMNFINCFVATMILGVGVDYGIHLIHRLRLNGGVVDSGVMETGKAVALAAITNIVGFGSLALSNYPGLRSVGIISSVGCLSCLITAVTLLPATLVLWRPKTETGDPAPGSAA